MRTYCADGLFCGLVYIHDSLSFIIRKSFEVDVKVKSRGLNPILVLGIQPSIAELFDPLFQYLWIKAISWILSESFAICFQELDLLGFKVTLAARFGSISFSSHCNALGGDVLFCAVCRQVGLLWSRLGIEPSVMQCWASLSIHTSNVLTSVNLPIWGVHCSTHALQMLSSVPRRIFELIVLMPDFFFSFRTRDASWFVLKSSQNRGISLTAHVCSIAWSLQALQGCTYHYIEINLSIPRTWMWHQRNYCINSCILIVIYRFNCDLHGRRLKLCVTAASTPQYSHV